jgi:xylosylprotein 4-beta-galactosyltransferase
VDPRLPYGVPPPAPLHLSPPGIHPEYMYPSFKGGSWLFTWEQLLTIDGYSHAYWGWGQEDDDLGARLRHAGVAHVKSFSYPGQRDASATTDEAPVGPTQPCTGRVQQCDHDPGERDCGVYPYSRLKVCSLSWNRIVYNSHRRAHIWTPKDVM